MKVIATARGYDNVTIREEGEVFDMPKDAKGTWFQPLEKPKAQKAEGKVEQPAGNQNSDVA